MNLRLKLGSALFIFVTSMANAFAFNLTVTADGTGSGNGYIQVYEQVSQSEVGACDFSVGPCVLTLTDNVNYAIVATPVNGEVAAGFSSCLTTPRGNRCDLNLF